MNEKSSSTSNSFRALVSPAQTDHYFDLQNKKNYKKHFSYILLLIRKLEKRQLSEWRCIFQTEFWDLKKKKKQKPKKCFGYFSLLIGWEKGRTRGDIFELYFKLVERDKTYKSPILILNSTPSLTPSITNTTYHLPASVSRLDDGVCWGEREVLCVGASSSSSRWTNSVCLSLTQNCWVQKVELTHSSLDDLEVNFTKLSGTKDKCASSYCFVPAVIILCHLVSPTKLCPNLLVNLLLDPIFTLYAEGQ